MKSNKFLSALLFSSLLLGACASKDEPPAEPVVQAPVSPSPFSNNERILVDTFKQSFTQGNFKGVITTVNNAPQTESGSLAFRTQALKYKAFSQCSLKQTKSCAATFHELLQTNPNFELEDTEKNHPIWGKVFEKEYERFLNGDKDPQPIKHKKKASKKK